MTSTSTDSSAATRVTTQPIGVKTISLMLCSAFASRSGGLNTVLMPGWWLSTEKAPVRRVERGTARRRCRGGHRLDGVVRLGPLLAHDVPGLPFRIWNRIRRRPERNPPCSRRPDDVGAAGNAGLQVRALLLNTLRREEHVIGGEGVAVLEFHALAQMEPPAGRLRRFPALRQSRDDLQILVAGDQAFEDLPEMGMGGALVERVGSSDLRWPWLA